MWSFQVMNKLLECASMYEYDDNGSTPKETPKGEETQPYTIADDNVTFDDSNISQHGVHPPHQQPPNIIPGLHNNNIIDQDHGMNVDITLLNCVVLFTNFR